MNIKDFEVGQQVFCYSFGNWYEGTVAKLGRTRLHVTYTTGSGKTRTKAFPLNDISLEKLEGGRQQAAKQKRLREIERSKAMVGQPVMQLTDEGMRPIPDAVWGMDDNRKLVVMEQRQLNLSQVDSVRLLCAFQALYMPSRFYHRTVTHDRARKVIEEMTGIRLKKSAKPPRPGQVQGLEGYIEWASNPALQTQREEQLVFLRLDDKDEGRWGVGIFFADDPEECQERVHADSEESAFHNAKMMAQKNGWTVIDEPEENHAHQG